MITSVMLGGGGNYKFGATSPEINTAGVPEEREGRQQQEREH